jgi:hypothetical protein
MEYVLMAILGLAVLYFWFKKGGSRDCCGEDVNFWYS